MQTLLALVLGCVIGLVMGALGGGGAILAVPVFAFALGQSPYAASTSALVVVAVGAAAGVVSRRHTPSVRWRAGVTFAALGVVGTVGGARLARGVPGEWLMGAFGVLLLGVAVLMWRRSSSPEPAHVSPSGWVRVLLAATVVGLLTGFFGVGGGFLIVPALTLVLGFPAHQAVGTSLLVITLNSLVALGPRLATDSHLDIRLVALVTAASVVGSVVGGRLGTLAPRRVLQRAFAVLLVAVAVATLALTLAGHAS